MHKANTQTVMHSPWFYKSDAPGGGPSFKGHLALRCNAPTNQSDAQKGWNLQTLSCEALYPNSNWSNGNGSTWVKTSEKKQQQNWVRSIGEASVVSTHVKSNRRRQSGMTPRVTIGAPCQILKGCIMLSTLLWWEVELQRKLMSACIKIERETLC